jgi:hypothetical protein
VSRRGYDLWARSLSDGREWALTTDGEPDYRYGSGPDSTSNATLLRKFGLPYLPPAVAWSPDSTKVLTHRTDERGVRQTHLVEARPADGGAPLLRTVCRANLDGSGFAKVTDDELDHIAWCREGATAIAAVDPAPRLQNAG